MLRNGTFEEGFRALVRAMFPEPGAELRLLDVDHPAWQGFERVEGRLVRALWGVDVGCRTGVIYCPTDLACYWELARTGRESQYSPAVQDQIQAAVDIGVNILAYATNRELRYKDPATPAASLGGQPPSSSRGMLRVANVLHAGDCHAARSALPNLLRSVASTMQLNIDPQPSEVRLTDDDLFRFHLIYVQGRARFELTEAERSRLRRYLARGGMVFADAICSSKEFRDSFVAEMNKLFSRQDAPTTLAGRRRIWREIRWATHREGLHPPPKPSDAGR